MVLKILKIFVRIDILERLFLMILNSNKSEKKIEDIKLVPEMLNLLGCNKDNFLKLLRLMNYKLYEKDNEIFFKYLPKKKNVKKMKEI